MSQHFGYLDGWRGIAIICLLIGHLYPVPGIDFGNLGVLLFLALSGYLMTGLLFVKKTPLSIFYRRRASRIFPALLFYVACCLLYLVCTDSKIQMDEFVGTILFLNYNQLKADFSQISLGHTWSLAIEEHAYIILSIIAVFAVTRRAVVASMAALSIACIIAYVSYWNTAVGVGGYGLHRWFQSEAKTYAIYLAGILLLVLRSTGIPRLPAVVWAVLFVGAICLHWWSVPKQVQFVVGICLMVIALATLPAGSDHIKAIMAWAPLRMMGVWSYSIYLWQQPFYTAEWPWYLSLPATMVCGLASYYLIESPTRAWLNANWGVKNATGSPGFDKLFS